MEKELLTGILTKIHNKTSEEISELLYEKADDSDEVTLKEGALDLVLDLDANRVAKLKSSATPDKEALKRIRDQHIKEIMEDFEKKLKANYGIDSTAKGIDLVKEIVNQVSECDITDEKVKTHPIYLELEQLKSREDYDTLHEEFADYKLNHERMQKLQSIRKDVLTVLAGLKPIVSENTVVAKTRQDDFLRKFDHFDYTISDDGNHLVMNNGVRVEDVHSNPVKFSDFVKSRAESCYEFKISDDSGNAGNRNNNGGGTHIDVPKDEKDYLTKMSKANTPEDRIAIHAAWQEAQK